MTRMRTIIATAFALLSIALVVPSTAHAETRVALVVGNAAYQAGALNTPANDAGLIAQTLQAAGFDVVGARDLDQDSLRRAFRDFLDKATSSGPDTVAFVYLSGYGVQLEGENYFVPIDARIARDADVTAEALRISDYTRPLAALKLKAGIVVLDLARANPFAKSGPPLAGGLALAEPEPGLLLALNAAPGTVAPEGPGPYGPYAQALAEMMREGGLPLDAAIREGALTRLRPVLITVGATVIALFPLASHGGPLWEPMCYAQIGGLSVATFITLLLVPVLYAIFVLDLKLVKWEKVEHTPEAGHEPVIAS